MEPIICKKRNKILGKLTTLEHIIYLTVITVSFLTVNAHAATGDALYVHGQTINMREGPSTQHTSILKLHKGHKLVEIDRKGQWVEVGAHRTSGKIGWVHANLVGKEFKGGATKHPPDAKFIKFNAAFNKLNSSIYAKTGILLFTKAENLGTGMVQITATDSWLSAPHLDRQKNLNTIFNIWDAVDGTGLAIAVYVVDRHGIQRMVMDR